MNAAVHLVSRTGFISWPHFEGAAGGAAGGATTRLLDRLAKKALNQAQAAVEQSSDPVLNASMDSKWSTPACQLHFTKEKTFSVIYKELLESLQKIPFDWVSCSIPPTERLLQVYQDDGIAGLRKKASFVKMLYSICYLPEPPWYAVNKWNQMVGGTAEELDGNLKLAVVSWCGMPEVLYQIKEILATSGPVSVFGDGDKDLKRFFLWQQIRPGQSLLAQCIELSGKITAKHILLALRIAVSEFNNSDKQPESVPKQATWMTYVKRAHLLIKWQKQREQKDGPMTKLYDRLAKKALNQVQAAVEQSSDPVLNASMDSKWTTPACQVHFTKEKTFSVIYGELLGQVKAAARATKLPSSSMEQMERQILQAMEESFGKVLKLHQEEVANMTAEATKTPMSVDALVEQWKDDKLATDWGYAVQVALEFKAEHFVFLTVPCTAYKKVELEHELEVVSYLRGLDDNALVFLLANFRVPAALTALDQKLANATLKRFLLWDGNSPGDSLRVDMATGLVFLPAEKGRSSKPLSKMREECQVALRAMGIDVDHAGWLRYEKKDGRRIQGSSNLWLAVAKTNADLRRNAWGASQLLMDMEIEAECHVTKRELLKLPRAIEDKKPVAEGEENEEGPKEVEPEEDEHSEIGDFIEEYVFSDESDTEEAVEDKATPKAKAKEAADEDEELSTPGRRRQESTTYSAGLASLGSNVIYQGWKKARTLADTDRPASSKPVAAKPKMSSYKPPSAAHPVYFVLATPTVDFLSAIEAYIRIRKEFPEVPCKLVIVCQAGQNAVLVKAAERVLGRLYYNGQFRVPGFDPINKLTPKMEQEKSTELLAKFKTQLPESWKSLQTISTTSGKPELAPSWNTYFQNPRYKERALAARDHMWQVLGIKEEIPEEPAGQEEVAPELAKERLTAWESFLVKVSDHEMHSLINCDSSVTSPKAILMRYMHLGNQQGILYFPGEVGRSIRAMHEIVGWAQMRKQPFAKEVALKGKQGDVTLYPVQYEKPETFFLYGNRLCTPLQTCMAIRRANADNEKAGCQIAKCTIEGAYPDTKVVPNSTETIDCFQIKA